MRCSPGSAPHRTPWCRRYGTVGFDIPALLAQVYLHYDAYTRRELGGKHHYSDGDRSDPARYAAMVAKDRALRLAGYEVYRFGGKGFDATDRGAGAVDACIDALAARHGVTRPAR